MPLSVQAPWLFSLASPDEIPVAEGYITSGMKEMSSLPLFQRMELLESAQREMEVRKEEIAQTIHEEIAKPLPLAQQEVERALLLLRLTREEAASFPWEEKQNLDRTSRGAGRVLHIRRVPLGPILAVTPFNFPLNLPLHKIAPALAAGCAVALKPAPQAPRTASILGEIFLRAGFPPYSLLIIETTNDLAEKLVESQYFSVFSFTGSARVGWYLKRKAGAKKVLLELGGNAGVIVAPDADLTDAAEKIARGGFAYSGQVCISVQRVFAHTSIYSDFRDALVAATRNLSKEEWLAPIISESEAERIRQSLRAALRAGSTLLCGGLGQGKEIPPTIVENVPHSEPLWREEIFGPVITLESYRDLDEAFEFLNDSKYGLQAALFTRNLSIIESAFRRCEVGALIINDASTFRADEMPFGGCKGSGIGREGPRWLFYEYTEPRSLIIRI